MANVAPLKKANVGGAEQVIFCVAFVIVVDLVAEFEAKRVSPPLVEFVAAATPAVMVTLPVPTRMPK